ncbi:hypothetical protein PENSPDRAFT_653075 [Peniophora sp. CONT]|nr:hypothetical protein PENSPDRAFT_653075 [Peniophora sp. CONT]
MEDSTSISPWSSLVNSRFSDSALSCVPRGLHLQTMDSELDSLMQAVFQARRMRNLKAGPCALPTEIIVGIFECLQLEWRPQRGVEYGSGNVVFYIGWISVSHVCSLWREVALGTPSLWSRATLNILDISHKFIPDILLRSQSALLDIQLDFEDDGGSTDTSLNAWLSPSILRRTRRLGLSTSMDLIALAAGHMPPSQDMGQLRELSVTVWGVDDNPELPAPFHEFTGLTSLTLVDCRVPWRSSLFSSQITSLHLSQRNSEPRPSYSDVNALTALHSLETLYLEDIVPLSSQAGGNLPEITFPKSLRKLTISATYEEIAMDTLRFITHINTPFRCSRDHRIPLLRTGHLLPDMALVDDILGRLLPGLFFAQYDDVEERYLELTSSCARVIGYPVASSKSASPRSRLSQSTSGIIDNRLETPAFTEGSPPISFRLSNYLSLFAFERLHTINLDIFTIHNIARSGSWSCLLRANAVRRIGVIETYMMHAHLLQLLDALGTRHVRVPGDETVVLFPQLEVLALPLSEYEMEHGDLVGILVTLVHARREQGAPLRELVIPRGAMDWSVWSTLGTLLKVSGIDYPPYASPIGLEYM